MSLSLPAIASIETAQTNPIGQYSDIQPLARQSLLLDIVNINNSRLVAVGERGHILTSNDGQGWVQRPVNTRSTLTKVYFFNQQLGWAVGHDSVIVHTQDGGDTWAVQQFLPNKQRPLFDIHFFSPTHGLAIGAYGTSFRTEDGGKSWHEEFHLELLTEDDQLYLEDIKAEDEEFYQQEIASILPHFNRLLKTDDALYMVGEIGLIAKSVDQGRTFTLLDEIYAGSFFDVFQASNNVLYVAGLRGNLFYRANSTSHWQKVDTHTTALLNDIIETPNHKLIVIANAGNILISDDGKNFDLHTQADGKALLAAVWFNNTLIAASEVGIKVIEVK